MAEVSAVPLPLVCVIGPTGTGKSKLGIHVARWLINSGRKAEIINVDAMQMYKGLPVATNQDQEGHGVKHHKVAFLDPVLGEQIDVTSFCSSTVSLINDLLANDVIPILVGGSNYYLQNILLCDNLVPKSDTPNEKESTTTTPTASFDIDATPPDQWHRLLSQVDPDMANKYHPNDTRRIKRSLQIYQQEGFRHSEIIKNQQQQLRFDPPSRNIIFWTDCKRDVLYDRLDSRVDKMRERGIVPEAESFWKLVVANKLLDDVENLPSTGIFGAIGFKELHPYLVGKETVASCLDVLKTNTRRYAKQQRQWIRNRFVSRDLQIFKLDTTDLSQWDTSCGEPSVRVLDEYFNPARKDTLPALFPHLHQTSSPDARKEVGVTKLFNCDICHKTLAGEDQYKIHIASRKHRSAAKRKEREPMVEKYKKLKEENSKKEKEEGNITTNSTAE